MFKRMLILLYGLALLVLPLLVALADGDGSMTGG
jgi:hypothetical protein